MNNPFKKTKKRSKSTLAYWLRDSDDEFLIGYRSLRQCDEIKRGAKIIADHVSNMSIMLMENTKKAGDMRLYNSLARFMDIEPNKNMTRKNFIKQIVLDIYLEGNAVCVPEFKSDGKLGNLNLLQASRLYFQDDYTNNSYKIIYNGQTLFPDEVVHCYLWPDRNKPYKGVDCADSLANTIQNLAQENATKKGFLKSEWKPSLVVSVSADAEELINTDLREKILKSYTGTSKRGEPWLIPAGEMDVKEVRPLSLNDLAIQDGIKLDIQCVAADLGIPPYLIGIGEFKKEAQRNFVGTTIMFTATSIQQELTRKLIYNPDWHFKFNPKSLLQYSPDEKTKFVKEMTALGAISRNEARSEFDYAPSDDPAMDEFQVLENYVPVDKLGDQKKLKGDDDDE